MSQQPTIGQYLIRRLQDYKVRHVFGVPGDYVLGFYEQLQNSPITVVGTTGEAGAGFAADAYARVNGMGAICVTYCVGGFNVVNSIAGAHAEKSPVVMITGSPGMNERVKDPMLHHKVKAFSTQYEIFQKITCASTVLDDEITALHEIDRVLDACWQQKLPVYIEIPRDMVDVRPKQLHHTIIKERKTDPDTLKEALAEAVKMINGSKKPVILADVEIHRFGLQKELVKFVEKTHIPVAATILGKSVISEKHPQYIGVYEGAMGGQQIQEIVEGSDCVIMLGTFLTDINLGIFSARLDRAKSIEVTSEKVQIRHHHYDMVELKDFIQGLVKSEIKPTTYAPEIKRANGNGSAAKEDDAPMTVKRLFQQLNDFLTDDMVVVCDVGDCLFGAVDLVIHKRTEFLAPAYYTSMGFGIPGALGAQMANPQLRPVCIVGDGAFQMTGQELSTILRLGLNPIVIVLNNHGYTTERFILDGAFNDITDWNYDKITALLGGGQGFRVNTPREFNDAWNCALKNTDSFSILNVQLDKMDHSPALHRLGQYLASHLKPKKTH